MDVKISRSHHESCVRLKLSGLHLYTKSKSNRWNRHRREMKKKITTFLHILQIESHKSCHDWIWFWFSSLLFRFVSMPCVCMRACMSSSSSNLFVCIGISSRSCKWQCWIRVLPEQQQQEYHILISCWSTLCVCVSEWARKRQRKSEREKNVLKAPILNLMHPWIALHTSRAIEMRLNMFY